MFMSSGCARNIEITSGTPTLVLKPLEETTEVSDLSEYISEVELIRMGTDSNVIPSISKLIPTRDCFFLISGGVVFSMSKDGSKIQKIGRVGILRLLQVFFEKSDNKVFPLIQRCILWIYIALIGASRPWPCGNPWVCYSRRG